MHYIFKLLIFLVCDILYKKLLKAVIMNIGNLHIDGFAALAPMAGVADRAFREICRGYGAAFTESEMISAKALSMGDKKSYELMHITNGERPTGIQLFGNSPEVIEKAVKSAETENPDFIDFNFGCPAPKIAGNGSGSALLKTPDVIGEILKSAYSVTDKPITAKIRIGWDNETKNAVKTATTIEKNGAVAITVHGRTRAQMYAPPVDTEAIREVKNAVSIPVIGNGDITDGQSAALMFEKTNCDLLMVGRGALGRPWVFAQINAYMTDGRILPEPPVSERMRVMLNHVKKICEYKGEKIGIKEARKHAAWYIKGIRNAAEYRQSVGLLESIEQLEEIAYKISISN